MNLLTFPLLSEAHSKLSAPIEIQYLLSEEEGIFGLQSIGGRSE
jgi:hypothetical protein